MYIYTHIYILFSSFSIYREKLHVSLISMIIFFYYMYIVNLPTIYISRLISILDFFCYYFFPINLSIVIDIFNDTSIHFDMIANCFSIYQIDYMFTITNKNLVHSAILFSHNMYISNYLDCLDISIICINLFRHGIVFILYIQLVIFYPHIESIFSI